MVSAWGTGKTLCGILRILRLCEEYPDNLALVCRREFTDLRDSTIKDFENYTGIQVPASKDIRLSNGSVIMFRHGEELNTLKNINLGACLVEQAEEFDDDAQWFILFGRMRRKNCGNPSLFLIANTNGNNWVKKLWKDTPAKGYECYEATTFDNADVLPESFLDSLETLRLQKPSVYNQYVMNSWDVTSGKIYEAWDEKYHVIPHEERPDWWETFGAIDTAVASGTFAAGLFRVDPHGNIIVCGEYYEKGKLISEHCQGIKQMAGPNIDKTWWADPSAFSKTREKLGRLYSVADELQDYGIIVFPGENEVNAGINRVGEYLKVNTSKSHPYKQGLLGSPRLFICECCVNLRREIPLYREVPNKISDRGERKWAPYKHEDHAVDFLRYGVMSRPITPEKQQLKPDRYSYDWIQRQMQHEEAVA